ncbi:MAG: hypothetical protein ABSH06_27140 [Thermodesulfobacteriota bacterium]|jgi:hypothetical protein
MINQLSQFYNDTGEFFVFYDPKQEELYRQATHELWETATYRGLKHHSYELHKACNEIQKKYRRNGLKLDLFSLPKGTHKNEGNFSAMVLKHFLQTKGFQVLVSEEDYYLMSQRGNRYKNDGFDTIKKIFGANKIEKLLRRAPKGGDPDVFAYIGHDSQRAWFIEAKRDNERLTKKQKQNFPYIRELLCPVEIARVVPSAQEQVKKETVKRKRSWGQT